MTYFLARPPASAPPQVPSEWLSLRPTWIGWDDSQWNLSDPAGGVLLMRGFSGFGMPRVERQASSSPALAGSRTRGHRVADREVFLPLFVYSDAGSQGWVDRDRAFWRTMDPDRPGSLRVTLPDGERRWLRCRFAEAQDTFTLSPTVTGWARYGLTLIADDPFWLGEPISRSFANGSGASFFGAGAPPFTISSGSLLSSATIDNPGDVDAWPSYRITGPSTSVTVGVGARLVEIPVTVAEGNWLLLDTDPRSQTLTDQSGADRTAELGAAEFAPVEPGQSVSLSLSMVGTGGVEVTLLPRFRRAW